MTKSRSEKASNDEIQRQFWQYRRVWFGILALLVAGRFLLPHLPLLRGWEQKFAAAAVEIGKTPTPEGFTRVATAEEAAQKITGALSQPASVFHLDGPILFGLWKCRPLKSEGVCLRYLWENEPVTLVIGAQTKKVKKVVGPFLKSAWTGYFIIHNNVAMTLVGPFAPEKLLNAWPYARDFAPNPANLNQAPQ